MQKPQKTLVLGLSLFGLVLADLAPEAPLGIGFIPQAAAVIGRPLTPMSYAGVARRTTRGMIYATSTYVATLPPACTTVMIEDTSLYQCGGTYYQATGTQYVVVTVE